MEPGDMIEWAYKDSGELVDGDEILYSSTMKRIVPIGGEMVHLLVSINDETLSWLNEKGLFHAREGDSAPVRPGGRGPWVVPRTRAK